MKNLKILFLLTTFILMSVNCFSQTVESPYEVGTWKGFAKAAVSYTFDDHCANQFTVAIPLFDEYDFKLTLYPVPNWGPNWNAIKAAAANGHEVGSHTMSHASLDGLSIEKQEEELSNSKNKINSELNLPGVDCNTIAYPNCNTGDVATIRKYYIAGRTCSGQIVSKTPSDYYNISSIVCGQLGSVNDMSSFKNRLTSAMNTNGWFVMLIHGIDNDGGYSPVTSDFLRQSVRYMDANRRIFWVTTFRNSVLYSKERDAVSVKEIENTATQITVEVTDNLDNNTYNLPVSIKRPLPQNWTNAKATQNGKEIESGIYRIGGSLYLIFDAVPDAGAVIITPSDENPVILEEPEGLIDPNPEEPKEPEEPGGSVEKVFDFESGNITGWVKQNPGAEIDITQEDKHGGNYALKMVNGSATNAWSVQAFTPAFGITAGHKYKVSFWVRAVGGEGKGRISTVNAGQLDRQYWDDFNVGNGWEQITYDNLTAGGNTLQLAFDMGYVANKTYYIDDIIIEDLTPDPKPGNEPLAAGHSKFLGNIIANEIPGNFDKYWNQITPENAGKWGSVEAVRGAMNWTRLDLAYNHAKAKNYPFKYHTLVWGKQEPGWLGGLNKTEQLAELEEFMRAVSERYPDIDFIDVVNEPLNAPSSMKEALGGDGITGWDWIIKSFEMARRYFPNTKLLLNEYGIISSTNSADNYLKIIDLLKNRELIDGIGIQCHEFNVNTVSIAQMKNILDKLGATGLPVYVSELDISSPTEDGQLNIYKEKFPVLWQHKAVAGITLWGYITGKTWKENTGIVNEDGTERKATIWLKEYMASEDSFGVGIENIRDTGKDIVSVNFTDNKLQVSATGNNKIKSIAVVDMSGRTLMSRKNITTNMIVIPISSIPAGLYICSVDTEKGKSNQKVLIK